MATQQAKQSTLSKELIGLLTKGRLASVKSSSVVAIQRFINSQM